MANVAQADGAISRRSSTSDRVSWLLQPDDASTGIGRTCAVNSRDLIEAARGLTELSRRRPAQANLRRAVSTAYYAMFHRLARVAADSLVGRRRNEAWHQVYRALEHGSARKACGNKQAMSRFAYQIQGFAETFVTLQHLRHKADYALEARYEKLVVLAAINEAEDAIAQLEQADKQQLRTFAVHVLFRRRPFQNLEETSR